MRGFLTKELVRLESKKYNTFVEMTRSGASARTLCFIIMIILSPLLSHATPSGLPIPRFVSLRSSEINLRVGPGHHFPTEWVYHRTNLPVQIVAEFGDWRKISDMDGTLGWVHKSMLSGHRYVIVLKDKTPLHTSDEASSSIDAYLENGVVAKLLKCKENYCRIEIRQSSSYKGWVLKDSLWGLEENE
jgi:SH3-like domain-containing protein